jgi:beta-lactamase regulating signal transducer with metallopeptidase domain
MTLDHCLEGALRVGVLLSLALATMPLLRGAPAAARRLVLALALAGALVLPLISALAPVVHIKAPSSIAALRGRPFAEPLAEPAPRLAPVAAGARAAELPAARSAPSSGLDVAAALAAAWALGALLVTARLALGLARSRAVVRRASAAPSWACAAARAARVIGVSADVRETDELDTPAVTGVLSPVVLVPRASAAWSFERRYAVLLHELAHVRQRDCLAQILAQLACAAHWFNPLVWLATRRLRRERELAADDAVLAAGARASSYAEDLLAIAGVERYARAVPAGVLGMAERSELASRITSIISTARARRRLSRRSSALFAAGVTAVLFAVACAAPEPAPPRAQAPAPAPSSGPAKSATASTIDPRLQQIASEELDRAVARWKAEAGAIVVLDPATGEVLANAGRLSGAPFDVATGRALVTGSTLKSITLAAALEEGVITAADRFDCENGERAYGDRILRDAGAYGSLTVPEMLAVSTNVGFSKVFDRLGGERLGRFLRRFHFASAPPAEGAAAGARSARVEDRSYEGAVLANGVVMTASPLEVAAAYAAIANDGVYVAPTLARGAASAPRERLIKPETARAVLGMLEGAVNGERATGKQARVEGVQVAGKTGTAEWRLPSGGEGLYASFVGIVPANRPRFVILVGLEALPAEGMNGGTAAAPAFARVASQALER